MWNTSACWRRGVPRIEPSHIPVGWRSTTELDALPRDSSQRFGITAGAKTSDYLGFVRGCDFAWARLRGKRRSASVYGVHAFGPRFLSTFARFPQSRRVLILDAYGKSACRAAPPSLLVWHLPGRSIPSALGLIAPPMMNPAAAIPITEG